MARKEFKEYLGHPGERQMAPLHEKPQASHPPWGAELGYMLDAAGLPVVSLYSRPTVTMAWCPQTLLPGYPNGFL